MEDQANTSGPTAAAQPKGTSSKPPYTEDQQDHRLVAMHFAFGMLAKALHAEGVLDLSDLALEIDNAQWLFHRQPQVQRVAADLAADLRYMRAKQGEPGHGHA